MAVAIQCAGSDITAIGAIDGLSNAGGMRIAELLAYDRTLSEQELKDGQAYLMRKWFGRAAPGYVLATPASEPALKDVSFASTNATVDIPAGQTVRLAKAELNGPVTVTGGGTLALETNNRSGDLVTLKDGSSLALSVSGETIAQAEIADMPVFHLDAADTNRMDLVAYNGKTCVKVWYDRAFKNFAYQNDPSFYPYLNNEAAATLNGKPV